MVPNFFTAAVYFVSLLVKGNILLKSLSSSGKHKAWFFLSVALCGLIASDLSWITWLLAGQSTFTTVITRGAWSFYCMFYLSLFLLLESLLEKNFSLKKSHLLLIVITFGLMSFIIYSAFSSIHNITKVFLATSYFYMLLILVVIFKSLKSLRATFLPKILKKQLSLILTFFISPFIIIDFLQCLVSPIYVSELRSFFAVISTSLITIAMYFCFRRIFDLRFLNFKEHVQEDGNFNFIYDFKHVLAQLGSAMNEPEVIHATKSFFHKALNIPYPQTHLNIRDLTNTNNPDSEKNVMTPIDSSIENFLSLCKDQQELATFLHESKIFIFDEIAFNAFYEEAPNLKIVQNFLNTINADIFLPIYEKQTIVAYIIVERNARGKELYTNVDRDEMVVFASYLGNIIYLLQNKNLDVLISKEHTIEAELYHKHQEINQYKESIRSFLRSAKERKIGLVFFKNRKFVFGNQAAQEFITINLNTQDGHPLTKAFKSVARHVETYKTQQSCLSKDSRGNRIVIAGIPHLEQNTVLFTVYYPEVSDVIKEQIDLLKDPSEWDYVLYLETTQSGQLINQLIPGNGPTLLPFKINLLKAALNKKATLLETAEEDLLDMVEILHHISLRHELHTIKLMSPNKNLDVAIKIFGINPIFHNQQQKPLLEQLNGIGTLFIQNIHLLDLETQQYLVDFIKYGFYRTLKSDQRAYSDVRIICSTNQNLHALAQEGKFLESLYNELRTTVSMPSLLTLSEAEFIELTNEYVEQTTQTQTFKNFFELTEREKVKLTQQRPVSLRDLKERIQHLLVQKSKKKQIYQETYFNPAYNITDPELAEAAKLGKHALRDQKIMSMLWHKFKNQNKIATFLGVNRSSVNRRCKDYNLL
jgi:hypothetical protein